eukprot:1264862-Amorphochlora_amoeboformis.AAC.2
MCIWAIVGLPSSNIRPISQPDWGYPVRCLWPGRVIAEELIVRRFIFAARSSSAGSLLSPSQPVYVANLARLQAVSRVLSGPLPTPGYIPLRSPWTTHGASTLPLQSLPPASTVMVLFEPLQYNLGYPPNYHTLTSDITAGTVRLVRPFVSNQRFPSPSVHHNPALIPSSPLSSLSAPKWHESAIKVSTQASTSMFKPRRGLFQMVRKLKDWKQMLRMTLVNGVDGLRARDAFDGQVNRGNENVTVGEMREVERESLVASALGGGGGTESRLVDDPEGMVARWRRFTETKQFTTMLLMVDMESNMY